jgi:hypothetical protein
VGDIGWQIVNSYMKNNEVSLQQLLRTNAQEIFEKSNINLKVMSDKNRSEIKFLVELDENRVPEKLLWSAQDGGIELSGQKRSCCRFGIRRKRNAY